MESLFKFEKRYIVLHSVLRKQTLNKIPLVTLSYWESISQDCLNVYLKVFTELAIRNDLSN